MEPRPEVLFNASEMKIVMEIRNAMTRHKKLGESVAVWQDGHVVTLSAENIPTQSEEPS